VKNKIKMVVFDMAGTVVDENNVVYKTVQKAINDFGFHLSLQQVLELGAGKEKLQAIKDVVSTYTDNTDETLPGRIYQSFATQLAAAYSTLEILPQPNAVELFSALKKKDILTILNTGYNRQTAETITTKLGWKKGTEYDELITASEVQKGRPNPDMIWHAMKEFGIESGDAVIKVGDSAIDIEEGKNAGCIACIGITTGAHTYEQLESASPDFIIDNLLELLPIIDAED
jgi:phosphonatase-like hydrolase